MDTHQGHHKAKSKDGLSSLVCSRWHHWGCYYSRTHHTHLRTTSINHVQSHAITWMPISITKRR